MSDPMNEPHKCDNPSHCTTCLNQAAVKATARRVARQKARAAARRKAQR